MTASGGQDEDGTDTVTLRLEGTFDGKAAELLRRSLQALGPNQDVVVDFSRVRSFVDLAVAVLTRDLSHARGKLHLRGLAGHPERMFRYFGLTAPMPPPAGFYVAEELRAG